MHTQGHPQEPFLRLDSGLPHAHHSHTRLILATWTPPLCSRAVAMLVADLASPPFSQALSTPDIQVYVVAPHPASLKEAYSLHPEYVSYMIGP